jgi:tetratricopeptide (TPR) repeat protein
MKSSMAPRRRRAEPKPVDELAMPREESKSDEEPATKKSMCIDILTGGNIRSFVDFFYLTHRPDPNPELVLLGKADEDIHVSEDDMRFIKHHLVAAEEARRRGDVSVIYASYGKLALYYSKAGDPKTAVYFNEKILDVARFTQDATGEMEGNAKLGEAYETLRDLPTAIKYHEKHKALARARGAERREMSADEALTRVYRQAGEELEGEEDGEGALEMHVKCKAAAKACGNAKEEALAAFRAGRAHVLLERAGEGIPLLEEYLDIVAGLDGMDATTGATYAALGMAYQAQGDLEGAVRCLGEFLKLAEESRNVTSQREACTHLGSIHNCNGQFDRAVEYFERAYMLARSQMATGSALRRDLDGCRVKLGMARGNAAMGLFVHVIKADMPTLLRWKTRRVELDAEGAGGEDGEGMV